MRDEWQVCQSDDLWESGPECNASGLGACKRECFAQTASDATVCKGMLTAAYSRHLDTKAHARKCSILRSCLHLVWVHDPRPYLCFAIGTLMRLLAHSVDSHKAAPTAWFEQGVLHTAHQCMGHIAPEVQPLPCSAWARP